ncbi:hypothetical protein ACFQ47_07435, partial [Lacticaseibacillus yichunensis]
NLSFPVQIYYQHQEYGGLVEQPLLRLPTHSILLLDEVTSGLSSSSAIRIQSKLLALPDKTIVLVTHQEYPELSEFLDQTITL